MILAGRGRMMRRPGGAAVSAWLALAAASVPAGSAGIVQQAHPLWRLAGEGRGTPAADEDTGYFLSKRHEVVAIDLNTGLERWRAGTLGTGPETFGSRVLTVGDVVVAGDYDVVGIDRRTGQLRWRFAPRTGHGAGIHLGRAYGQDVFTGSAAGYLHAVDARTGRARWSVPVIPDGDNAAIFSPSVGEDDVVAGYTEFSRPARGGVVVIERQTGRERWRYRFPPWVTRAASTGSAGDPVLLSDLIIAASQDGTVFGLDRATGRVRWVIPAGPRPDGRGETLQDFRSIVCVGGVLVVGSLTGMVLAYDLETRQERWRAAPVSASVAFGLAADGRFVYVPYLSGHLVALDAGTGVERWRAGGPAYGFTWLPLVSGERVLVAGSGAGFLAFARDGPGAGRVQSQGGVGGTAAVRWSR